MPAIWMSGKADGGPTLLDIGRRPASTVDTGSQDAQSWVYCEASSPRRGGEGWCRCSTARLSPRTIRGRSCGSGLGSGPADQASRPLKEEQRNKRTSQASSRDASLLRSCPTANPGATPCSCSPRVSGQGAARGRDWSSGDPCREDNASGLPHPSRCRPHGSRHGRDAPYRRHRLHPASATSAWGPGGEGDLWATGLGLDRSVCPIIALRGARRPAASCAAVVGQSIWGPRGQPTDGTARARRCTL